jgi:hypothetical protein
VVSSPLERPMASRRSPPRLRGAMRMHPHLGSVCHVALRLVLGSPQHENLAPQFLPHHPAAIAYERSASSDTSPAGPATDCPCA